MDIFKYKEMGKGSFTHYSLWTVTDKLSVLFQVSVPSQILVLWQRLSHQEWLGPLCGGGRQRASGSDGWRGCGPQVKGASAPFHSSVLLCDDVVAPPLSLYPVRISKQCDLGAPSPGPELAGTIIFIDFPVSKTDKGLFRKRLCLCCGSSR